MVVMRRSGKSSAGTRRGTCGDSHGTAGVAYALAAAGRTLNRRDLVDVATRGAGLGPPWL